MKLNSKNLAVYRALDANCNRVREGLRVAEDTARFIFNDPILLKKIKNLRHRVTSAERDLFQSSRLRNIARDIQKDLGRGNVEKSERSRKDPGDLFRANLKRAQEGLRSLEEFSKLIGHPASLRFKIIRYECYKIEEKHLS